jgi:pyruvate-formate lyase-activating enzyme
MRGGAQRLKMSREVMYNTLSHVSHIGCLTLTGGEPSLATDVMEELISFLKWHKVTFSYFYIVTNGKTRNGWKKFLDLCGELCEMSTTLEVICAANPN